MLPVNVDSFQKNFNSLACVQATCVVAKYGLYLQSEDILSGPHNFKSAVWGLIHGFRVKGNTSFSVSVGRLVIKVRVQAWSLQR